MIYINRRRRDENGRFIRPSKDWFRRAKVATKKAIQEGSRHRWDTGIYADNKEVRAALEKLFFGKCAYCEQTLPELWDVEHYRPKSRVAERKDDHPGYYWLGYTWQNMYPACTNCNRRRKDKPLWDDLRALPAEGKYDQFPLYDEFTRAMSHQEDVRRECALLIDPCNDDPELYLGYDPKGQIVALDGDPFARRSIEVYNLRRRRLCKRRKKIMNRTAKILKLIKGVPKARLENKDLVKGLKDLLREMISDEGEHAGAARFVRKNASVFVKW